MLFLLCFWWFPQSSLDIYLSTCICVCKTVCVWVQPFFKFQSTQPFHSKQWEQWGKLSDKLKEKFISSKKKERLLSLYTEYINLDFKNKLSTIFSARVTRILWQGKKLNWILLLFINIPDTEGSTFSFEPYCSILIF